MCNELRHCPFCGGMAKIQRIPLNTEEEIQRHPMWEWRYPGMYVVGCDTVGCFCNYNHFIMLFSTREEAKKVWNRRVYNDDT